jgi:hypothetical protein
MYQRINCICLYGYIAIMVDECNMSKQNWWKMLTRNNRSSHRKTYPSDILSTLIPHGWMPGVETGLWQ